MKTQKEIKRKRQRDQASETIEGVHHVVSVVTSRKDQYGPLEIDDLGRALVYFFNGERVHFDLASKPGLCALCTVRFEEA